MNGSRAPARRSRLATRLTALLAVAFLIGAFGAPAAPAAAPARNVILMIPDGCPPEAYALLRWYTGAPLALDSIYAGAVKTYIADSVVADSAPAATAYATGTRTSDKHIGVGPRKDGLASLPAPSPEQAYRPLATLLEGARLLGKSTGIVATSSITHATPAAFVAHVSSRKMEEENMFQAVHQSLTVAFGGGLKFLLPAGSGPGVRADGRDLSRELQRQGVPLVTGGGPEWQALAAPGAAAPARVFALFAAEALEPDFERAATAPHQPSLEEMTRTAIALLARNPNGFFLMVEGSQVDWACHANDPGYLLSELGAFDRAVAAALDFARQDGHTLVVAASDHATGGLSIGNAATASTYSQMPVESLCGPLRRMTCTAKTVWRRATAADALGRAAAALRENTGTNPAGPEALAVSLRRAVADAWGIALTAGQAAEIVALAASYAGTLDESYALGEVVSRHCTVLGWTSHGHTGGDVALFAYGPGAPHGMLEAPALAQACAAAMGLNLEALNRRLLAPAAEYFAGRVQVVDLDANADGRVEERRLRIGDTAEAVIGSNLLRIGDREHELEGLILYAPERQCAYLPLAVVRLLDPGVGDLPVVGP